MVALTKYLRVVLSAALWAALVSALTNLSSLSAIAVTHAVDVEPSILSNHAYLNAPEFKDFITQVKNGNRNALVGVYVPFKFAFPVTQQPQNDSVFVSTDPGVVTQFRVASRYGTVGLLAHNNLAGASFFDLQPGETVYLVYGDGHLRTYMVKRAYEFQALDPTNTFSNFVNQDGSEQLLTSAQLFREIYAHNNQLVFQTCIERDGEASWGRIFIEATPSDHYPIPIEPLPDLIRSIFVNY